MTLTPFNSVAERKPTDNQIKYYRSMIEEVVQRTPNLSPDEISYYRSAWRGREDITSQGMSGLIVTMKAQLQVVRKNNPPKGTITEGFYAGATWVSPFEGNTAFKVQRAVHGSGKLYAKELVNGDWTLVSGLYAHMQLNPTKFRKLTAEEAGAFGKLYGMCIICSRTLTDEESISRGIGPICAGKL